MVRKASLRTSKNRLFTVEKTNHKVVHTSAVDMHYTSHLPCGRRSLTLAILFLWSASCNQQLWSTNKKYAPNSQYKIKMEDLTGPTTQLESILNCTGVFANDVYQSINQTWLRRIRWNVKRYGMMAMNYHYSLHTVVLVVPFSFWKVGILFVCWRIRTCIGIIII